jgi:site-specific recombinase XerC
MSSIASRGTMTTKQAQFFFEQHLRVTCTKARYRRYCFVLDRFLSHFAPDRVVDSFLYSEIQQYREERRREGAAERTIELECTVAKTLWDWLLFNGHSNTNPFRGQSNSAIRVADRRPDAQSQWQHSREQSQSGRRVQA